MNQGPILLGLWSSEQDGIRPLEPKQVRVIAFFRRQQPLHFHNPREIVRCVSPERRLLRLWRWLRFLRFFALTFQFPRGLLSLGLRIQIRIVRDFLVGEVAKGVFVCIEAFDLCLLGSACPRGQLGFSEVATE
jgi:hypothetical protein